MKNADIKQDKLNPKQEKFCQLYTSDKEFFGNGVESYLEVYNVDTSKSNWYKSACSSASRLLSNVKVIERINELLEDQGLNDAFVDKQLKFLITQHSDFSAKMNAIKEYNKLRQRIVEKTETTSRNYNSDVPVSPEEISAIEQAFAKSLPKEQSPE